MKTTLPANENVRKAWKSLVSLTLVMCSALSLTASAKAESGISNWYLPIELSDLNTVVRFEVDSTWHMVKGVTSGVTGTVRLTDMNNPTSLQIDLSLPVAKFNTDNSGRDKRMLEVMESGNFPTVSFRSEGLRNHCSPALVLRDGSCDDSIPGELTIHALTLPVELPVRIAKENGQGISVSGKLPIRWADYGVEDPSIFVARLNPTVTIYFKVLLKPMSEEG